MRGRNRNGTSVGYRVHNEAIVDQEGHMVREPVSGYTDVIVQVDKDMNEEAQIIGLINSVRPLCLTRTQDRNENI